MTSVGEVKADERRGLGSAFLYHTLDIIIIIIILLPEQGVEET